MKNAGLRHAYLAALAAFMIFAGSTRTVCAEGADPQTAPTSQPARGTIIEVEPIPEQVRSSRSLGTRGYVARDGEKSFLEQTPPENRTDASILDEAIAYDLTAHRGHRVAWFGIVREIKKTDGGHQLLLEHKYFDGLTDLHILALSFNGAGDFSVLIRGDNPRVSKLELIRVYGRVEPGKENPVTVNADYIRVFPWKTFTFLDCYGKDNSNPLWRKICKAPLDTIYNPYPDDAYYEQRLGKPDK